MLRTITSKSFCRSSLAPRVTATFTTSAKISSPQTTSPSASASSVSEADQQKIKETYQRMGLTLSDPDLMTQAITHKSFAHATVPTNERLDYIGRSFLELHVTDRKLDVVKTNKTLKSSMNKALSTENLASVARSFGVDTILRWTSPSGTTGQDTVLAGTMQAIVGAVYHDQGSVSAREFVAKNIYKF